MINQRIDRLEGIEGRLTDKINAGIGMRLNDFQQFLLDFQVFELTGEWPKDIAGVMNITLK